MALAKRIDFVAHLYCGDIIKTHFKKMHVKNVFVHPNGNVESIRN
jgi:hypothetical protein